MDAGVAERALALIYAGQGRDADALLLQNKLTMRLTDVVLQQPLPLPPAPVPQPPDAPCIALDQVLPAALVAKLVHALRPDAPFWNEHEYSECSPYFSYWHDLHAPDDTIMEQAAGIIQRALLPKFPELAATTKVEWWAHSRQHKRGHQLHWDSDSEGYPVVLNPIASAVVYLSAGVGGPTLVTQQLLSDTSVAKHGWLIFPPARQADVGRVAAFSGSVLHGVVGGAPARAPADAAARRTTLMFAFWRSVKMRPSLSEDKGACRPLPIGPRYTFVREITPALRLLPADYSARPVVVAPDFVAPVFAFCDPVHSGDAMVPYEELFQGI